MKKHLLSLLVGSLAFTATAAEPGFISLTNGQDLTGWRGNPKLWSVQGGAIVGVNPADAPVKHNTFLVYTNDVFDDFELRFSYKLEGGNSGVQYRSRVMSEGEDGPIVGGYQADFEAGQTYSGILYEERGRGILAQRGQITKLVADPADPEKHKVEVVGSLGQSADIQAVIKQDDWNEYVVIANGNQFTHLINGRVTAIVIDEHPAKSRKSGVLAFQVHAGPPMKLSVKDVRIRPIK